MTLLALAGIAVVGILSVAVYQWWTNRTTEDDDIEVRKFEPPPSSPPRLSGIAPRIGVATKS